MSGTTRVDFHVHSNHSDGLLNPEEVAAQLAASGVSYAALTDHDTVAGLATFERAARRRQMGAIPGVEMTVELDGEEAHLLAYGFAPDHPELLAALAATRRTRPPEAESGSMDRTLLDRGSNGSTNGDAKDGRIEIGEAIDLIHDAGGRAFLAHPLVLAPDTERLRALLGHLAGLGLDGVEVFYGPYSDAQRARLLMVANELGLLVCGGSDLHEKRRGGAALGVSMPTAQWKRFRDAVLGDSGWSQGGAVLDHPRLRLKRRHFFLHVVLPTVLAIVLFFGVILGVLLPSFERSLLERKREMIRELTHSAISILMSYERDVRNGEMTLPEAQQAAAGMISNLRYGPEGLDYFWIQDMRPRMVMHPYRTDLNGQDVSEFTDPRGVRIFVKFAEIVREQGGGYVDYVWQWKDDPTRLAPKESYVQGFQPWGWVIGTGLYTEDVHAEIGRIESNMLRISIIIIALIALLLSWVLRASLRLERRRREAEDGLRESSARYRSLVEATTEGALLVEDGRCRYANAILLQLIGASQEELELLDLEDVLPRNVQNEVAWTEIARVLDGQAPSRGFEGVLLRRDGALIECVLSLSRMTFAGRSALILLVKPIGGASGEDTISPDERSLTLGSAADSVDTGLLRARATPQGTIVHANRAAARMLRMARSGDERPASLPGLLGDDEAWSHLLEETTRTGAAERRLHLAGASGLVAVRLSATLVRGPDGRPAFLDCSLEDVTHEERRAAEREAMIRRLQRAMLFLHEPVGNVRSVSITCRLDESVAAVVRRMTARGAGAALVEAAPGEVVGIFTDHDLRERVIAQGRSEETPVGRVMSAPVASVPEHAEIYEALVEMEERGLQHLGVEDHAGRITGVIRHRELLQFPSYGPMVLAREISHAEDAAQVIAAALRAPGVAEALTDSGAPPERITRMLTAVCDAATERFIELAQAELGPPPVPFCFLAEGSHGREELTPGSDQDNALVYADDGAGNEQVAEYFLALGRRVCGWLDDAGYPYCRGEIMAQTPRWSQPLSVWKRYFTEWVRTAEPQEVMEFLVFFDFRPVAGDSELAEELREHVFDEVRARPAFLAQLAQQVRRFRPPVRLFGRIISGGAGDHSARTGAPAFNVKDAMASITGFARLYALRGRIAATNTWERLSALSEAGELTEASRDTSAAAFSDLMRLRLEGQARSRAADEEPDNLITWRALDDVERTMVNQAFAQIAALQSRVSHDFLADT